MLPDNYFGARPRRSCEQALNILIEKIYTAWRTGKVLTLITFDIKGAYNGVNIQILITRLRQRGIPETLIGWIESFYTNRKAQISLPGFQSEIQTIEEAGLPQGSLLSLNLFNFYNTNLVEAPINKNGGAIGFVDDYTRWVVGETPD